MDVTSAKEAVIAQNAGACAVMALEKVPSDIIKSGGVARMVSPIVIEEIRQAVTIPVMAKVRIGHTAEAQVLEQANVDFIDESEVLTPADYTQIQKKSFKTPFVCGCRNLVEALQRLNEGAAMIRSKGDAGTGDIRSAVTHFRNIQNQIQAIKKMDAEELSDYARNMHVPLALLLQTAQDGRIPAVLFAAGGIATPADAALMMQLGADGVFVGSVGMSIHTIIIYG